jgi:Family of unknown function (DUF6229)
MSQLDDVVSDWLSGSDISDGCENPAGPLYIQGEQATNDALANPDLRITAVACRTVLGATTCSYNGGCLCC